MTNQADDVVDKVEEGISNEEADAPTTDDVVDDTNQTSEEASPSLPWWKQKRVLVIGIIVLVISVVVAIVLGVTLSSNDNINTDNSSSNNNNNNNIYRGCFNADNGGYGGILWNAVRSYVDQDCANNKECEIGQIYGWPMNSWCVGSVKDMSRLFQDMDTFNEDINGWNTSTVTNMIYMFAYARAFNQDLSNFDTSRVTNMYGMFKDSSLFNRDLSNFDTSKVTNMNRMFEGASSFNQDLCSWQDNFPYTAYNPDIFLGSGCTYQDTPQETQKGPFCASDCQSSQESTTSSTLPAAVEATTTSNPQQQEECIDTANFLDLYGGGCDLYALPANEAWCGAYGNDGEVGMTPNENCCVCK